MSRLSRIARGFLATLLMISWTGALPALAQPVSGKPSTPADIEKSIDELNRLVSGLEIASRQTPRDTFDPQAVLEIVGRNPAALFAWVRDRTTWVPYQGSLRGARGVLMDRSGNSLDRALLLAELVRTAGTPVRLARATLSADQASKALGAVRIAIPTDLQTRSGGPTFDQQAAAAGLDATAIRQAIEKTQLTASRLAEDAVRQSTQLTPALLSAVGAGDAQAPPAGNGEADALAAIADHWWVEAQLTGDAWTALDPLLPDAAAGTPFAAGAAATIDPLPSGAFVLPPDRLHTVEVRVVIEQWKDGKAREATVLSERLRPSELLGQRVMLYHLPIKWPDDKAMLADKDPVARYRKTAAAHKEWMPVLSVGEGARSKASFTTAGDVNENPNVDPAAAVGQATGGLFGGLGGAVGGEGAGEPAKAGVLTAEWIEYVIRAPGREDTTVRRQVFDLRAADRGATAAGPTLPLTEPLQETRALALFGQTEMLLLPCYLSSEFVTDLSLRALIANRDVFVAMRRGLPDDHAKSVAVMTEMARKAKPLPGTIYNLALARRAWSPVGSQVYLDRPNVLAYHLRIDPDAESVVVATAAFDIVANDVAVRRGSGLDPFRVRLQQGVADTVAESVLLSIAGPARGTARAFDAAAARGEAPITLRAPKDLDAAAAQLPAEVRQRVARDLADGYVVVLPSARMGEDPLACGWWRVDPRSGGTLGIGGHGWGATLVEASIKTKFAVTLAIMVLVWGACQAKFAFLKGFDKMEAADDRTCACAAVLGGFAFMGLVLTGNPQIGVGTGAVIVGGLCA